MVLKTDTISLNYYPYEKKSMSSKDDKKKKKTLEISSNYNPYETKKKPHEF